MCGLFAYTGPAPDAALLATAAAGAAQRGPHGHGWAGAGLPARHGMGRLPLADVAVLNAPHIIGHARLATMGAAHDDPAGLQPVHVDGHWLAHNGNVYNAGQLDPDAPTDSGALATCYAGHRRFGGMTPAEALKAAIALADQRAWAIIILDSTGQLLATRFRLPIWRHADDTGAYYSSRPFAAAELIPEDTVHAEAAW